ncbi:MAG TPA: hypothetical protein VN811_14940 [Thermoanaerobaculia bacterium]|nr:hypothetical protein [Thermoanaerobaculia bacterium]HXT52336.1 hypothetical protein [Thermoanaerobaculia bacterium]
MSQKAADFVAKLSSDSSLQQRYKSDPEAVMSEAGLSDEDKAVLRTNDPAKITAYLGDDAPPGCFSLRVDGEP